MLKMKSQTVDYNAIMACNDLCANIIGNQLYRSCCCRYDTGRPDLSQLILQCSGINSQWYTHSRQFVDEGLLVRRPKNVTLSGCDLSCWGNITVEDKLPPVITNCPSVTLQCGQSTTPGTSVPRPSASDACSSDHDIHWQRSGVSM